MSRSSNGREILKKIFFLTFFIKHCKCLILQCFLFVIATDSLKKVKSVVQKLLLVVIIMEP